MINFTKIFGIFIQEKQSWFWSKAFHNKNIDPIARKVANKVEFVIVNSFTQYWKIKFFSKKMSDIWPTIYQGITCSLAKFKILF